MELLTLFVSPVLWTAVAVIWIVNGSIDMMHKVKYLADQKKQVAEQKKAGGAAYSNEDGVLKASQ